MVQSTSLYFLLVTLNLGGKNDQKMLCSDLEINVYDSSF